LRSGRAAEMAVVGLATTNKAEDIKPYSDLQIVDYQSVDYESLQHLLNSI
jgi:beta-phosphoglucomutase-like phosphatase (HAD superfamily)